MFTVIAGGRKGVFRQAIEEDIFTDRSHYYILLMEANVGCFFNTPIKV
jgi:hypothetical protein